LLQALHDLSVVPWKQCESQLAWLHTLDEHCTQIPASPQVLAASEAVVQGASHADPALQMPLHKLGKTVTPSARKSLPFATSE
jgi:hypothetical protein